MGDDSAPSQLSIEYLPTASLKLNPRNARTHTRRQIRQLHDIILAVGFLSPIVLDDDKMVLAGHARLEAAKLAGMKSVPTVCAGMLSEAQRRAYVLADNRLAESSGWDREKLVAELNDLAVLLPQIDLDLTITGFEPPEIDTLFADRGPAKPDPADALPIGPSYISILATPP